MSLIALGVTGGIGAYKAVEVARGLQKQGHDVVAVLTRTACRFITPLTFEAITRRRVVTDQFTPGMNADIEHVAIASDIALLVVAPATAHVLARFAHGLADDFLTSLYLATRAPVLVAPAMNTHMWEHPATRQNLATLQARGVHVIDPGEGFLACGWIGKGRLAEPDAIVEAAVRVLRPSGPLAGQRVVVSAGPTFEDLDPVRFLGNRSSGRMGYALAAEAVARGAQTVLVSGPCHLDPPPGAELVRVRRAAEMYAAVIEKAAGASVVIMAAAVADYTPATTSPQKIKKDDGTLGLTLVRTKDILGDLGRARGGSPLPVLVGFAAETDHVVEHGRGKLASKGVDLVVANDVSRADAGFEVDTNAVTLLTVDRDEVLPVLPKRAVAVAILDRVERILAGRRPASGPL